MTPILVATAASQKYRLRAPDRKSGPTADRRPSALSGDSGRTKLRVVFRPPDVVFELRTSGSPPTKTDL